MITLIKFRSNYEDMSVLDDYFNWMVRQIGGSEHRLMLGYLNSIMFTYNVPRDENRMKDVGTLRYYFSLDFGVDYIDILQNEDNALPASVLEVLLMFAIKLEHEYNNPGDHIPARNTYFWEMVNNLYLGGMIDDHFDPSMIEEVIDIFLSRGYNPDGSGGNIFVVPDAPIDMRSTELWAQANWYLRNIIF